jgi:hypothetical protein
MRVSLIAHEKSRGKKRSENGRAARVFPHVVCVALERREPTPSMREVKSLFWY